jgi:DNA gyrase subunit A
LETLLGSPARIRELVSSELDEVAERFGTPRRTLLTEAKPSIATSGRKTAPQLEVADVPCRVILSTTGRAIRVDLRDSAEDAQKRQARRVRHDAIRTSIVTTSRSEIGAVTSLGRLVRLSPVDLPVVPDNSVQLAAGVKIADYLGIDRAKEKVLALVSLSSADAIALGTRHGVVKRISVIDHPNRPDFDLIALKPGDEVVGARQAGDDEELLFITSDAQLLRFAASSVRPQGRSAGGMAGIRLSAGAAVIFFTSVAAAAEAVVATVSTSSTILPGVDAGRAKVSALSELPVKGRATGGVRAHSFLKGEDILALAWAGPEPALAVAADGAVRALPDAGAKRDASGVLLDAEIASIGASLAAAR